jgi:hypothetical protein
VSLGLAEVHPQSTRLGSRSERVGIDDPAPTGYESGGPMRDQAGAHLVEADHPMVDSIDPIALAALRPGMPVARLADALGSLWRPLPPHKAGRADILENSHGFVARLDVDGAVAWLKYDWRFPTAAPVDGVHMGASLAATRDARPDLAIEADRLGGPDGRYGFHHYPDGSRLLVTFTMDMVNRIQLFRLDATFAEALPPPYPEPAGAPGAPFADPALKLAVLSALLDAKAIDLGTPEQLAAHVLGRAVDPDEEGYVPIPEVRDWLERYPLDDALLARVTKLVLDGGSAIYPYVDSYWGGEDEQFDVATLAGIEHCPNLAEFHVTALIGTVDLRQLTVLPNLRVIQVGVDVAHLEALLAMPALEAVGQMSDAAYGEAMGHGAARAVYEALKARGVRVWVHWMTHTGPGEPPAFE